MGTGIEISPDMNPEDALAHYGVKGMKWGVRREERLQRLERVQSGTASTMDKLKTGTADVALGSAKSQINAQVRAARELKSATERGEGVAKAAMKYYGTRTVPQVAALTFNRASKSDKVASGAKEAAKDNSISRKDAKAQINNVSMSARQSIRDYNRAQTPAQKKAAADSYEKSVLKVVQTPEFKKAFEKANAMGKGEMALHVATFGPLAAWSIPAVRSARKNPELYEYEIDSAHRILKEMRNG